ncbi:MAG: cyclic nucleotide-binding domain-containing protein [Verrucomicrobia bacterium]|nr:cyclic nucleotide-binding domain-containing protein [Verrucomicrobiota bacterium]
METTYLNRIIREHRFLHGLNPRYFHLFTEGASLLRFGIGQDVFREGTDANHFYLIHTGQVSLETFVPGKGVVAVQTIGSQEALGWSWLYPPYRWHFTARAIEPCELVAFGAASLRQKADENHDFGYDLMRRVSQVMLDRLQATRRKLIEFYGVLE